MRCADLRNHLVDRVRVDGRRLVSAQSQKNGAIGGVPDAGERKRSVQVDLHASAKVQERAFGEPLRKSECGAHWTHRVRTGWTDADLIEIKKTSHLFAL